MKSRLLDFLICPACKAALRLDTRDGGDDIETGTLSCESCAKVYPIVDGIPRILPDGLSESEQGTRNRFAYAWRRFGPKMSERHGSEFLVRLPGWAEDDFRGRLVLDVGCGAGRFVRLAREFGARDVVAIDLSSAIDTARQLSKDPGNIHFVQAGLHDLPFGSIFDIVYCMGVLHHTPDPAFSFDRIVKYVKPGGRIGVWVYSKEGNEIMGPLMNFFRKATVRFPDKVNDWLAFLLVTAEEIAYFAVLRHFKNHRYAAYLDYFNNFLTRHDRQYVAYDFLSTPLVHYLSRNELLAQATTNSLDRVVVEHFLGNGNSLTAVKPV